MKLKLILSKQSDADFTAKALSFYRPSSGLQIVVMSEVVFCCSNPLVQQSITSEPDIGLSLYLHHDDSIPALHLSESLGVLYIPKGCQLPDGILRELRGLELYIFAEEAELLDLISGGALQTIKQISEFYRNSHSTKVLITQSPALTSAIMGIDSSMHCHLQFRPEGKALNLGAEESYQMRMGLALAENIAKGLDDLSSLDVPYLRGCLRDHQHSYTFFADSYDEYMAHVDYQLWVKKILNWNRTYSKNRTPKILELACGTANISCRLVAEGYQVDACDLSAQMLENAAMKTVKPNLYQASLTDPIPGRDYGLVLCFFDSINYLLLSKDISICFAEAKKALVDGGLFIFDVSTLANSLENFSDNCQLTTRDDSYMVHEAIYEPHQKRQISRLYSFKQQGCAYYLQTETHTQRVYLCEEIISLIEQSGLKLKAIHSTESATNLLGKKPSSLDNRYYRLFFITQKDE